MCLYRDAPLGVPLIVLAKSINVELDGPRKSRSLAHFSFFIILFSSLPNGRVLAKDWPSSKNQTKNNTFLLWKLYRGTSSLHRNNELLVNPNVSLCEDCEGQGGDRLLIAASLLLFYR